MIKWPRVDASFNNSLSYDFELECVEICAHISCRHTRKILLTRGRSFFQRSDIVIFNWKKLEAVITIKFHMRSYCSYQYTTIVLLTNIKINAHLPVSTYLVLHKIIKIIIHFNFCSVACGQLKSFSPF